VDMYNSVCLFVCLFMCKCVLGVCSVMYLGEVLMPVPIPWYWYWISIGTAKLQMPPIRTCIVSFQ